MWNLNEWSFFEQFTVQAIQRQLEEVAEKQRDLEERGVAIEKNIRREDGAGKPYSYSFLFVWVFLFSFDSLLFFLPEESLIYDFEQDRLYQTWFELVLEKNRLARYESELMIL